MTHGGFDPVGEPQNQPFQLSFNPCLKVDFLLLAEGHLTRGRFAAMLRRIAMLPLPAS
jgi:hypothetical protein